MEPDACSVVESIVINMEIGELNDYDYEDYEPEENTPDVYRDMVRYVTVCCSSMFLFCEYIY